MQREDIINNIQRGLDLMDEYGINTFRSEPEEMNALNPAFGFRASAGSSNLSSTRGVMSVWMKGGARDITVHTLPRGYGGPEKNFKTRDLSDSQLQAVSQFVHDLCRQELQARKQAVMNPPIGEILPAVELWSKQCAAAAGPQFSAFVSYGKRAYDRDKYHAVVIFENNDQIGSISLRQTEDGRMTYNERTPLGGEWMSDEPLDIRHIMTSVRDSIASITCRDIRLLASRPQNQLLESIRSGNLRLTHSDMDHVLDINRRENKFRIGFVQDFSNPGQVGLELTATPLDRADALPLTVARGTVRLDARNAFSRIEMEATGSGVDFLDAMETKGLVEAIDLYNVYKEDKWMLADVTKLYTGYLRLLNRKHLFSPLEGIGVALTTDTAKKDGTSYTLHARLGGVVDLRSTISSEQAELLLRMADKPLFAYLEQQVARDVLDAQLKEYDHMQQRITGVQVTCQDGSCHIRCLLDGVQQLRRPLTAEQYRAYTGSSDKNLASSLLAATVYRDELLRQDQSSGLKR